MAAERILLVDDEQNARSALRTLLTEEGYDIREATDGEEALALLGDFVPAIVFADVRMPRMDGLTLLKKAKEQASDAIFLMMTAFANVESAVEAMRAGAENYLTKPVALDALLVFIQKALEKRRLARDAASLRERVHDRYRLSGMVGDAPELQAVFEVVKKAAPTKATVLILGAHRAGRARGIPPAQPAVHQGELRGVERDAAGERAVRARAGSFTGAVGRREGRFELADGGTLFLDEIGEIPPAIQVKLLRALQQREFERVGGTETLKVDVRVVAATNRDLATEVKEGRFREELFYRLNVVTVTLPPLRRRKGDIPALVSHFMDKYGKSYGKPLRALGPGTLNAILAHDWPGNVRELENAIERAVVLSRGGELTLDDLPPSLRGSHVRAPAPSSVMPGATLREMERDAILRTLALVDGSTARAAKMLGISVRKVQYRLKEYRLTRQLSPEAPGVPEAEHAGTPAAA